MLISMKTVTINIATMTALQNALSAMDTAVTAITDDVYQWVDYADRDDAYARECKSESRIVINAHADAVADAAIAVLRVLRPSALSVINNE